MEGVGVEVISHYTCLFLLLLSRSVQKQIEMAVGAARESWKQSQQYPFRADTMNGVNPETVASNEILRKIRAEWEEENRMEFQKSLQDAKQVLCISFCVSQCG